METTSIRLAVLSVGAMFIASFASSTHSGLANVQQNKTSIQPQGGQNTQGVQSITTAITFGWYPIFASVARLPSSLAGALEGLPPATFSILDAASIAHVISNATRNSGT